MSDDRFFGIGSSEIGTIMGVNPYQTSFQLWLEKTGEFKQEENVNMRRGKFLEKFIGEEYQRETGEILVEGKTVRKNEILRATPDFLAPDGKIVEVKAPAFLSDEWGEPGTDEVPPYILLQVLWQMGICEKEKADIVVMPWGRELLIYPASFREGAFREAVKVAEEWWEKYIVEKKRPPLDHTAGKFLEKLHRQKSQVLIPSTPEMDEKAEKLAETKHRLEKLEAEKKTLENELKDLIGEYAGILGGWGQARWTEVAETKTLDAKKLTEVLIGQLDQVILNGLVKKAEKTRKGYRRLAVKFAKQGV